MLKQLKWLPNPIGSLASEVKKTYKNEKKFPGTQLLNQFRLQIPMIDCFIKYAKERREQPSEGEMKISNVKCQVACFANIRNRRV